MLQKFNFAVFLKLEIVVLYNNVVKFRDIAMRGPWTSGGIEFNFGTSLF
jgi:hypothetical protein